MNYYKVYFEMETTQTVQYSMREAPHQERDHYVSISEIVAAENENEAVEKTIERHSVMP